ncbi:unnamed protein product [Urochloa humidicola]
MAKGCTLTETIADIKKEVAACAADLKLAWEKNKELESEKASAEQLMALVQQDLHPILEDLDVELPALEGLTLKAHTERLVQMAAMLKEVVRQENMELVKHSASLCGSYVLAILKSNLPGLDLSVLKQGIKGSDKEAVELVESLGHLVEPMADRIKYDHPDVYMSV